MSISRTDASYLVNTCIKNATNIQGKIATIKTNLAELINSSNGIVNNISRDIKAGEIISGSNRILSGNVGELANNTLNNLDLYLKTLCNDVNGYIDQIESSCNKDLKEGETPLYFKRIAVTSSGGYDYKRSSTTANTYRSSSDKDTTNKTDNKKQNTYQPSNTNDENTDEFYKNIDYILDVNSRKSIDSNNFNNWDLVIKEFARRNGFENKISSLSLRNKEIICKFSNGEEIILQNISSSSELINMINILLNQGVNNGNN